MTVPANAANTYTVPIGVSSLHIEIEDQNGNVLPVANLSMVDAGGAAVINGGGPYGPLTSAVATFVKDDTGFMFSGVEPGQGVVTVTYSVGQDSFTLDLLITVPTNVTAIYAFQA